MKISKMSAYFSDSISPINRIRNKSKDIKAEDKSIKIEKPRRLFRRYTMKVIDLSMPLYTGMDVFPGDPQVNINLIHTHEKNTWELRNLSMGSHTGTHVDAFSHMHKYKGSLDDIPIDRFLGKAQVVELFQDWPKETGLFFIDEIGLEKLNKIVNSNPGFVGGNIREDLQRALLEREIITYTELINLELIPKEKTFMFFGLPLKIKSGDGSPVRAIAII